MPYDSNGIFSLDPGYLAVLGQTIQPSQHNPPLEDIVSAGLSNVLVRDGRAPMTGNLNMNNFKVTSLLAGTNALDAVNKQQLDTLLIQSQTYTAAQQAQARSNISAPLKGYITDLTISNNASDPVNDFDIAPGQAASEETNPVLIVLSSSMTKRVDALWAAGSGNGGLDTGSITSGTVHIWLIQRSDTGAVDVLLSASATTPVMPSSWDRKRRIGSVPRAGGANYGIRQVGDDFLHNGPPFDGGFTNPGTSAALRTLTVPTGITVDAIYSVVFDAASSGTTSLLLTSPAQADLTPDANAFTFRASASGRTSGMVRTRTDTSARIRSRLSLSDASAFFGICTNGWVDTRGKG